MPTLEQLRALDAFARQGTFQRAAAELKKRHTAIIYSIENLERDLGLTLLDRRGYRTTLNSAGLRVLEEARPVLLSMDSLVAKCSEIRTGWEPRLRLVFDGIFPAEEVLGVVAELARLGATTRIEVSTEFLGGVETAFARDSADLMISVVSPEDATLRTVRLAPIDALLVAHSEHPLGAASSEWEPWELAAHVLLTVRGSDPRLQLSTEGLRPPFSVQLNDFYAKKAGILAKMGFGWMPEHLVASELARGVLRRIRWKGGSAHRFEPRLYFRSGGLGRAASLMRDGLREGVREARGSLGTAPARKKAAPRSG